MRKFQKTLVLAVTKVLGPTFRDGLDIFGNSMLMAWMKKPIQIL